MMDTINISLSETFGTDISGAFFAMATGHANETLVPAATPEYQFGVDILRDVLAFLAAADGDGLFLSGPTGCGKTSVILEIAARLNWPVRRVNGHARMELHDLVGSMSLSATDAGGTKTVFKHGPLARAMQEGSIFILDEVDLLDPSIAAGLNPILEGNPLVLTENGGEVIRPHPFFRFVATGNTAGMGDDTGAYSGTVTQNLAYLDRFWVVKAGYPAPEVEEKILAAKFGDLLAEPLRERMIKLANEVREQFVGTGRAGATLSVTFSTRTLIRWAGLFLTYSRSSIDGPKLQYTLERALTARAAPHEAEAIHEIARMVFAEYWV